MVTGKKDLPQSGALFRLYAYLRVIFYFDFLSTFEIIFPI